MTTLSLKDKQAILRRLQEAVDKATSTDGSSEDAAAKRQTAELKAKSRVDVERYARERGIAL